MELYVLIHLKCMTLNSTIVPNKFNHRNCKPEKTILKLSTQSSKNNRFKTIIDNTISKNYMSKNYILSSSNFNIDTKYSLDNNQVQLHEI